MFSSIEDGPRAPKAGPLIMDERVVVLEPARPLINSQRLLAEIGTAEIGNPHPEDVASAKADGRVKEAAARLLELRGQPLPPGKFDAVIAALLDLKSSQSRGRMVSQQLCEYWSKPWAPTTMRRYLQR